MIGTEYKSSTGISMMLGLDQKLKKPQLYIHEGGATWKRIASFNDTEAVESFLKMFGMSRPDWLGATYQEALEKRLPFIRKDTP